MGGTVCDDHFDQVEADIACHMLFGVNYYALAFHINAGCGRGSSNQPTNLDDLACTGNETSLFDCVSAAENCGHSEDVGVTCGFMTGNSNIRLTKQSGCEMIRSGTLEVLKNSTWE